MINFTSALYLGLHHPSWLLQPWQQLSLGVPAALTEPPGAGEVAQQLAQLQGCEQGVLLPSTLHLFWDLFGMLFQQRAALFLDEGTYAVVRWGVEQFRAKGGEVHTFRHHDPDALLTQIKRLAYGRRKYPVAIADGFCPACGRAAPVGEYLEIVRHFGGILVLDDTQALGILGEMPALHSPYGKGGGGVLRWSGNSGPDIIVGSSLAKGLGVPVAVLTGSRKLIKRFKTASDTRVHGSPPSVAVIQAARHALIVNRSQGDWLRQRLAQRVTRFRSGLAAMGLNTIGGWFPVQILRGIDGNEAVRVHQFLSRQGIQTVLSRPRGSSVVHLSFLMTARHTAGEIDHCIDVLATAIHGFEETLIVKETKYSDFIK
ncbi:8-amino-7-oxononanoate synthase [Nitrosomonas eutropha]|uniref:aminotransferase class I/II-fold pyridoxal phosphate-dependent enzyme n=1 Tax=Nitrosomonas eutropha TaxID=916 RepID=UPI000883235D|nr:aminotransferase class I/II-fold pyridoxal phosphate-dependent enzyme [Nitrosomonas eutropha]SCW99616.1 8-amino-7-oxononanoate synthase [Nitrosomonas eutropha]